MSDDGGAAAPGRKPPSERTNGEPHVSARAREIGRDVAKTIRALNVNSVRTYRPNICKVPDDVRKEHDGAYDPKFASIGPFHHGNRSLAPMEEIKLLYNHDLLERDSGSSIERCAEAVLNREVEARRQYSEKFSDDDSRVGFVKTLLVDGCFIVEFLLKRARGKVGAPLSANMRNMPTLRHDLLLIENQIPFFVLEAIYDVFSWDNKRTLLDLALHYLSRGGMTKEKLPSEYREQNGKRIYHLLHLQYLCLLQGLAPEISEEQDPPPETLIAYLVKKLSDQVSAAGRYALFFGRLVMKVVSFMVIYLLYVLVSFFEVLILWRKVSRSTNRSKPCEKPRMVPTAKELQEAGVSFRRKEAARCYLDVSFKDGRMRIPRLNIQQNTSSEFRNLLALEQSCPDVGNYFTSYVVLMDNLVDTADDVAVLKSARILESKLGSDEHVARFFNGMRSGLYFNYDKHHLIGLFEDLNNYCNHEHNRWRAKLMHDYFGNPWTILSLIGAVVLLVLTALQTVYTIRDSSSPPPPSPTTR